MSDLDELYKALMDEPKNKSSIGLKDIIVVARRYWSFLWSKKWIVISLAVIGAIIGYIYAYNRKITYTANYVFTVGGSGSSGALSLTSLLGMGGGSMDAFSGDNVLELLKSRTIVEKTLLSPCEYKGDSITFMEYSLICDSIRKKCESGDMPEAKEGQTSICDIHYPLGQDRSCFSRVQDSILMVKSASFLKNNISVSRRDKKLSYMEYWFSNTDEEFAKSFSKAHLKAATDFYIDTKTSLSRKNLASFQEKADSIREELNKTIVKMSAYTDGNRNASGTFVTAQLKKYEIDVQVLSTAYQELEKNIKVLELDLAKETPLIQVIDSPVLPLPNDKLRKLKAFVIGGFLGGFLACLGCLAFLYIMEMKEKLTNELKGIDSSAEDKKIENV